MGKRKRDTNAQIGTLEKEAKQQKTSHKEEHPQTAAVSVQIVLGTYEKVLHGIKATVSEIPGESAEPVPFVEFADTFLLSPHSSAIRCLAISPQSATVAGNSQKIILASGGSDQVINLFHLSGEAPPQQKQSEKDLQAPRPGGKKATEDARNRELGSLQHHGGAVNALYFPTRSKLLSAADDNTIAVARTRDWTVLSTIKAPIPEAHGRPSGDTAPLGATPAGVSDFAIHPSLKLMLSVGKGEKCMRLWNLVTGKKAGVLSFERSMLQAVGEGRWTSGEGRRVAWNSLGEEFVVAFEKGCVVFGMDCKPKYQIIPSPSTKIHQLHYTPAGNGTEFLVVSTEDGRLLFYPTNLPVKDKPAKSLNNSETALCKAVGQLGGATEGLVGRIKDFEVLEPPNSNRWVVITGSSDGAMRLWEIDRTSLHDISNEEEESSKSDASRLMNGKLTKKEKNSRQSSETKQIGKLLGTYETGNRITCLKAFVLTERRQSSANSSIKDARLDKPDDLDIESDSETLS